MRASNIAIAVLCAMIFMLLVLISLALDGAQPAPEFEPSPPKVNTAGLCIVEVKEPEYEMYFSEADIIALAQMAWGEARGCTREGQAQTMWAVLNRVDVWGGTPYSQTAAPHQFYGYSPYNPITPELYTLATDVLARWSMEKQGVAVARELPHGYLWFTGNGTVNIFREAY